MMNTSMIDTIKIILDSAIIVSASLGMISSIFMFLLIVCHLIKIRPSPNRVPLLLTANMYLSIFLFCTFMLDIYVRILSKRLFQTLAVEDDLSCRIRAYLCTVVGSAIFYSNMLQAIFRLCRIVYYNRQRLQQFSVYLILIVLQWFICCLFTMPNLLLGDFVYFPNDFQCQNSFFNQRSTFYNMIVLYAIPIDITIGCYMYTVRKTRGVNNPIRQQISQTQRLTSQRDVIVLFRICILQLPMLAFSVPMIVVYLFVTFGSEQWWGFHIEWLTAVVSIGCVNIILAFVSPHLHNLLRNVFARQRHVRVTSILVVPLRSNR